MAVIPAFDEDKSIGNVVKEVKKYVDHVVVVDDSSVDNTPYLARRSGATVLRHYENSGVGAAITTGIEYAKKLRPDIVVTLDADGQHKPEDIPRLIRPIVVGKADWVLGSRFKKGSLTSMSLIKRFGNRFFTFITSIFAGVKLTDTQTGFRALNREALLALDLRAKHTYVQEMTIILCLKGFRVAEVPIQVRTRKHGNSKVVSNFIEYGLKSLAIVLSTYIRQKNSG